MCLITTLFIFLACIHWFVNEQFTRPLLGAPAVRAGHVGAQFCLPDAPAGTGTPIHAAAQPGRKRALTRGHISVSHVCTWARAPHIHMCTRSPVEVLARALRRNPVPAPPPSDRASTSIGCLASLPVFWPLQLPSSAGNLRALPHSEPP